MKNLTMNRTANLVIEGAKLSATANLLKKDLVALRKGEKISLTAGDLTKAFKGASKEKKLEMVIGTMKTTASLKGRQFGYVVADNVQLDLKKAELLINDVYRGMDENDIRLNARQTVKTSLTRAIEAVHEGSVKVNISDKQDEPLTIAFEKINLAVDWLKIHASDVRKIAAMMKTFGLSFYDVAGAVSMEIGEADNAMISEQAKESTLTAAQLRTKEQDFYRQTMKNQVLAEVVNG